MDSHEPNIPPANISTPEELLSTAELLLATKNPKMMRAVVLEAISALETFVHKKVFSTLREKLDPILVDYLEDKTKMDFESRLKVLTPIATGLPIDTAGSLWKDFKTAKNIRNNVTHKGIKVTPDQARFVIDTVYRWIAYFGSSIELQTALTGLLNYFDAHPQVDIQNESQAVNLLTKYFSRNGGATIKLEPSSGKQGERRPDITIQYGPHNLIIETKFVINQSIDRVIRHALDQLRSTRGQYKAEMGAVVIFYKGEIDPIYEHIQVLDEGKIFLLVIGIK